MVQKERIEFLNNKSSKKGDYVLYFMQASERVKYNHALSYAVTKANDLKLPLVVFFGLKIFKNYNLRHYTFMIEGLREIKESLEKRGIKFIIQIDALEGVINLSKNASFLVTDKGYLKEEILLRKKISKMIDISFVQIESNSIIPVLEASDKEEYGAFTIRPKILSKLSYYAKEVILEHILKKSLDIKIESCNLDNINMDIDNSVYPSNKYKGGYKNALKVLDDFILNKLEFYSERHNDPSLNFQSELSPYLHFGQISPIEIYLRVKDLNSKEFLEELIVRRELAINFVTYNKNYDNYKSLPNWAINTFEKHKGDKKDYTYKLEEIENYKTNDVYFNKCQEEMVITGKMHGYMRMYWAKKIIEWMNYKKAYQVILYLNNKYNLDGTDPSSYTGVAWAFGKHDRPFKERPIFGIIRYMNSDGLKRKFNMENYLKKDFKND